MEKKMKGYRKLIAFGALLIWSPLVAWIFREYSAVLIPMFSLIGTGITVFFAGNWLEHREERIHEE
jgi:hypothetical protein